MSDWAKLSRSEDLAELFESEILKGELARLESDLLTKRDLSDLDRSHRIGRREALLWLRDLPANQVKTARDLPKRKEEIARHPNPVL